MSGLRSHIVTLALALGYAIPQPAPADDLAFLARVKADTQWLASYATRQVGTPEHAQLQDDLLARLREIPGAKVWTHEFPVIVPVTTKAVLEVSEGAWAGEHPIRPLWPDVARLNTTAPDGIRGRLVYVGDAGSESLPAHGLQGQIAVMEMSAYCDYRRVFNHGAAAVLLLESERPGETVPTNQSLYKPRYHVEAGQFADALRAGEVATGRIVCAGEWKTVTARNIYVAVVPEDARRATPYAMVAAYDSMSRVIGLAPGADMALDCATVLNILRDEATAPRRPLLFGFVDAYHINQLGMRTMAAMLTVTPDGMTRRAYMSIEQENLEAYQQAVELDPDYAAVYVNLASAWLNLRKADKAIAAYQQFLKLYAEEDDLKRKVLGQVDLLQKGELDKYW